ncbi:MAG: Gfo/Idh/MocA family oxidoreductase [Bacteroidales bacterium]|jgi:predicted dehydrogenase|nr:Gfo/Idh/MocA family oxidoreductase [Bacteroidales bacterium]
MIRTGIICPSEIALRRFLPAFEQLSDFEFIGVAIADKSEWTDANDTVINSERIKAEAFVSQYGGRIFESYASIIHSDEIDAVYLPLPPALHFTWAKQALKAGKHILVEKPATTSLTDANVLLELARKNNLAVHENYMFTFHNQLAAIDDIVNSGEIGDVRLYRISFGFPRRSASDFRYNKTLGGGALLDAGGYTIKYASLLLGETAEIVYAQSNYTDEFEVDIYGSAALVNDGGTTAQVAFGMDNSYKCDLEIWGSKGCLTSGRVLTAPANFIPEVSIKIGDKTETRQLPSDDAFKKSIEKFRDCIENGDIRSNNYKMILRQAKLVKDFIKQNNIKHNG